MSSTYSTNLAIELIGAGEQAGTWSTTTNTNLGTLIEQAISGYQTQAITDGADTVITIPNGATGVARNMIIECTGALTGARNLIVPANKKLYFIYNNTTGGQAVTVKVSGQTGVSVPNGAKVALMSNGTDVVIATNYMVSPTLTSPTLTGTPVAPTASTGTNTTQVATTAFVQSALIAAYPIGSIYMSTVATNPGTLLGFGTWVAYGVGRMPISADGSTYVAGTTGGSATTTLSTTNLPSHTHTATLTGTAASGGTHTHTYKTYGLGSSGLVGNAYTNYDWGWVQTGNSPGTAEGAHSHSVSTSGTTDATGSGTAVTTISPYIAVYMWNRTA
jgi:hypothetical protein